MKRTFSLITLAFALLMTSKMATAQNVLLTLSQGEQLLHAESSLSLFDKEGGLQVCTVDRQGKFHVYKNKQKLGPYSDAQKASYQISFPENDNYNEDNELPNQAYNSEVVVYDDSGNNYIKFGGKKLGPFRFVKDLYISPDGKNFLAVVAEAEAEYTGNTRYQLISSSGKNISLKGEPYDLKINPSVQFGLVATKAENEDDIDVEALNRNNAKIEEIIGKMSDENITMEKLVQLSEELAKLTSGKDAPGSERYHVYTSKGEVFGPFQSSVYPDYGYNCGDKWHMIADGKLYIAGKPVKNLDEYTSINGFWWSKTGNNYAYRTSESIVFSSGQTYSNPIEIKVVEENGQTILKWLTFENESKFVLYHKVL